LRACDGRRKCDRRHAPRVYIIDTVTKNAAGNMCEKRVPDAIFAGLRESLKYNEGPADGASGNSADADVLDLGVVEEPVLRALAARARFLDAAEGRDFRRDEAGVEPDDAVLERFRHAP